MFDKIINTIVSLWENFQKATQYGLNNIAAFSNWILAIFVGVGTAIGIVVNALMDSMLDAIALADALSQTAPSSNGQMWGSSGPASHAMSWLNACLPLEELAAWVITVMALYVLAMGYSGIKNLIPGG